jgi:hypothetical protein
MVSHLSSEATRSINRLCGPNAFTWTTSLTVFRALVSVALSVEDHVPSWLNTYRNILRPGRGRADAHTAAGGDTVAITNDWHRNANLRPYRSISRVVREKRWPLRSFERGQEVLRTDCLFAGAGLPRCLHMPLLRRPPHVSGVASRMQSLSDAQLTLKASG